MAYGTALRVVALHRFHGYVSLRKEEFVYENCSDYALKILGKNFERYF